MRLLLLIALMMTAAATFTFFNCNNDADDPADARLDESDDDDDDDDNDNDDDDDSALCPEGMAYVPSGETVVVYYGQRWDGWSRQKEWVDAFCVDVYEASQPDSDETSQGSWITGQPVPAAETKAGVMPWVEVSFEDSGEACQKAGKRLPTLAEWQTAFSGFDGVSWPWGNNWKDNSCYADYSDFGSHPTGGCCFPIWKGDYSFEVCDTVGNVSEWVSDWWDEDCYGQNEVMIAGGASHLHHEDLNNQVEDPDNPGCWLFQTYMLQRAGLHHHPVYMGLSDDGFRCALSVEQ